ncbi:TonB-dependent receptor [Achromobacter arsenitoxydans]|uniref:Outer membrane protein TonB-dependent receptor n=1 Tax=Achromobacter arsenitoxydans SY8 TaxID=477184 RepID=H0F2D4_9BURK|nr:TonB-dependent siderophore receptor [Achromobacter arsenitoxydans]EHK67545.1 outer membrane protein TonB-dependent receptor [Achromobacter arsenitoxydans SY8]
MRRVVTTAAFAACTAVPVAQAQEAEMPSIRVEAASEDDSLHLDSTSGSASRLGLTIRETPASVEILTQQTLRERGATTLSEALRGATGLAGGGPPSSPTTLSSRGFTDILYLYDGLRMSGAGTNNRVQDTWNYERIEVLKGPASVLQGDSAIGGIVNFQTKRPDRDNPSREAMFSYGSYGNIRAGIGLGDNFGETGAYRIDYSHNDSRVGTIDRNSNKLDHLTTGVAFDVAPRTRLDLSFDYSRDTGHAYWGTPLIPRSLAKDPTGVVSTPDGRVLDRALAGNNYNVLNDRNEAEAYWWRARVTHQLSSSWTLRNELAMNKVDRLWKNSESATFSAPDSVDRDQTLITHNQRYLINRFDATHTGTLGGLSNKFVIGGELSKTSLDNKRRFSNRSASTADALRVSLWNPDVGYYNDDPALMSGPGNRTNYSSDVRGAALFLEDALKLTDRWTVVGGYRYDRIHVDRGVTDLNAGTHSSFSTRYNANSVRLGTVFDVTPSSSIYAQYTNATIPVGSLFLLSEANSSFPLAKGEQWEAGFKQTLGDVEWTAAVYHIKLENVLTRDANDPRVTVNNGRQSSRGVELSADWRITPQLTVSGNIAALNARYDSLTEADGTSRIGNTPPNVPERVANLYATYRLKDVPMDLFVGLNHTGKMYTDSANQIRINGHTTVDAAISYRLQPAVITFRVRNLTDKLYAYYGGRATSQVLLAPGRTYELGATFYF